MPTHKYAGKTVKEIHKTTQRRIKNAPFDEGSPSWDDIMDLTWEEVEQRAQDNEPGFRTVRKLLDRKKYDK
jgi:hypothetical protein